MSFHQTSICFVCSHLTLGKKEGDELRRNSDVLEILRKMMFPRVHGPGDVKSPETIIDHEQDLHLQIEQKRGRVFEGWREGRIYFSHLWFSNPWFFRTYYREHIYSLQPVYLDFLGQYL
ncbi:hypothetical protein GIB67_003093 [Kingdonia uniflora]|uniref:Uncharacterized protein n=1 Tax=Kingdonia uniflora TaxID=39325 RepID=A0A7J7N5Y8_9MAGN|nr:hypothetical protein GIB67_003093 [Kingdonia uniflora]